jgi:[ribosomal protein S5]-alanine N-acetyltransferase
MIILVADELAAWTLASPFVVCDEIEVGYLIHRPYWRRATEAALACCDYAFNVLDHQRVISLIRPENEPSQGVAGKLGMQPELLRVQHGGFEHRVFSVCRCGAAVE